MSYLLGRIPEFAAESLLTNQLKLGRFAIRNSPFTLKWVSNHDKLMNLVVFPQT